MWRKRKQFWNRQKWMLTGRIPTKLFYTGSIAEYMILHGQVGGRVRSQSKNIPTLSKFWLNNSHYLPPQPPLACQKNNSNPCCISNMVCLANFAMFARRLSFQVFSLPPVETMFWNNTALHISVEQRFKEFCKFWFNPLLYKDCYSSHLQFWCIGTWTAIAVGFFFCFKEWKNPRLKVMDGCNKSVIKFRYCKIESVKIEQRLL